MLSEKKYFAEYTYRNATLELNSVFEMIAARSLTEAKRIAKAMVGKSDRHRWLSRVQLDLAAEERAEMDEKLSSEIARKFQAD